jgi:hypothetical protein
MIVTFGIPISSTGSFAEVPTRGERSLSSGVGLRESRVWVRSWVSSGIRDASAGFPRRSARARYKAAQCPPATAGPGALVDLVADVPVHDTEDRRDQNGEKGTDPAPRAHAGALRGHDDVENERAKDIRRGSR